MGTAELDILAKKSVSFKAGDETITIKEPSAQFYVDAYGIVMAVADKINAKAPGLWNRLTGQKKILLTDLAKLTEASDLIYQLLALLVPDKGPKFFKEEVNLQGLLAIINGVIELVDIQEVQEHFFALAEKAKTLGESEEATS